MNLSLLRYQSPSIIGPILEENSYRMGIMKKQINYRDQKIDRLFNKLDKVDVACNWDYLFNPKELGKLYDDLCSKEEVTEKEVMDYLFRECMAVHARNKVKDNAKGHRYSALLIRFACMLRAKMNAAGYIFSGRRSSSLATCK